MKLSRLAAGLGIVTILFCAGLQPAAAADPLLQARQDWQTGRLKEATLRVKDYLQNRPDDAAARLLMARIDLDLLNGRAAENNLTKAEVAGAGGEMILEPLAQALLLQGAPQRVLDEIPAGNPDPQREAALTALRGEAYRRLGKVRDATRLFDQALALDSDQQTALLGSARVAFAEHRLDDGRALINRATAAAPTAAEPWELLAELDFALGNYEAADASLVKAEIVARNKAMPRFKRALTRIELGRLDAAEADIEKVADAFPNFAGLDLARGAMFLRRGEAARAVAALSAFLKHDPGNLRATFLLGLAEMQRGNDGLAEGYLERYLDALPESPRAALALAQLRLSRNDFFGAEDVLSRMADQPGAPVAVLAASAEALAKLGRIDEAEARIAKAIGLRPENPDYRVSHAEYLSRLGRNEEAAHELDAAVRIDPLNRSAALLQIKDRLQRRQFADALAMAQKLAGARRDDPYALNALGLARIGVGDIDGARAAFDQALAARPGFSDALLNQARLALRDGDSGAARRLFEEVLATDPGHTEAVLGLGELDAAAGDTRAQIERLQRAVEAYPGNLSFCTALGRVLLKQGEPARALTRLQSAPAEFRDAPELLLVQGEAELALGANEDAIKTYQALLAALPSRAASHYLLARAYAADGQTAAMRESLVRGVQIDSGHALAPATMDLVLSKVAGFHEQLDLLNRLLRVSDDDPRMVARKADLYVGNSDYAQAEALIAGLRERYPDDAGVMRKLVGVQRAAGEAGAAITTLEDWIDAHPEDDPARLMLAQVYAEQGRDESALALLRDLAAAYPANAAILNNLAWLMRDSDPEQALKYAEQAHRLAPKDPAFLDTLGALLLARDEGKRALELLDQAHYAEPGDATIAYHYARALAMVKRRGDARLVLLDLIDRPFPEQEAARQLLAELSN